MLCLGNFVYLKIISSVKSVLIHYYKSDVMFTIFFENGRTVDHYIV